MPKPKTTPSDLRITVRLLADLTPYPKNPRHITPAAVNAVAESLAAFGWQQPVVIDSKRVIVAGHTRRLAALQLGWTFAPTVTIAAKHARSYRLADNRSGEFSTWDLDVLGGELAAIPTGQLDALPALDFAALALPPLEGQTDPDDIPAAPKPRTKLGDVWTLGDHRLMCGDSTDQACVHTLLDGASPALMVTDPPYGVNYNPTWRDDCGGQFGDGKTVMRSKVVNDSRAAWAEAYVYFSGAVAYCWHPPGANLIVSFHELLEVGLVPRWQIIWVKPHFVITRGHYHLQHEGIWYAVRKGKTAGWIGDRKQTSVWEIAGMNPAGGCAEAKLGHGTQKPVECMERPIRNHKGDVYDPFVGSGTTIIAAEREKRRCYAMEIAPEYVDIAVARWEAFTGRTAQRRER